MSRWFVPVGSSVAAVARSLALAGLVLACTGQVPADGSASPAASTTSPPGSAAVGDDAASPSAPAPAPGVDPPQATLAAEGGDPVVGQLGSFTWADGGSDSPWLPGAPATVGAGEPLTVSLVDGVSIETWSARRVPAGTTDGAGAVALGNGSSPATFAAPGPGSWSVQVQVTFAGGLGSGAYYWQLTVR